jgi:ABC-type Na+ efflux pump permease subunit
MIWLLVLLAACALVLIALAALNGRGQQRQRASQTAAEPDWVALSMQIGGASDFQHHDGSFK